MPLPTPDGRQHQVIYLPSTGHHVIQGTAGSGKTVMAILRAAALSDPQNPDSGRTLLLTHDNSLSKYIQYLADDRLSNVIVETFHRFARGYLQSRGLMRYNCISDSDRYYTILAIREVRAAYDSHAFFDRPIDFFVDEFEWIAGYGLTSQAEYLAARRVGRKDPLSPALRRVLWRIRDAYIAHRTAAGELYAWWDLASAVRVALETDDNARRYRHIIVDEAQDFSPEVLRALSRAIPPNGSLTLFLDESQQIYGQRTSWRACGLRVQQAIVFTENYRNTPEIAAVALAMSQLEHFQDTPDLIFPTVTRRAAGSKPTLFRAANREREEEEVRRQVTALGRTARVGVLARRRSEARRAISDLSGAQLIDKTMPTWDDNPGVYYGTYYAAKGLEFEIVVLPFVSADNLPEPDVVKTFGLDEANGREARQLYVGVTRARTELLVTFHGALTGLLPPEESQLWERVAD